MRNAAQKWLGVEQALSAQVDALALELAANPGSASMAQLQRSRRYQALRGQVDDELRRYAGFMDERITAGQRNMATMALQHSAQAVNAVATEAGIVAPFDRISIAAVEDMIGMAGDGTPLRAILDDATRGAGDRLGQVLVDGVALGKNPVAVARQAMRLGLGQSFTRMQAIARTESLRVYRTSTLASYQASRVVIAYRRLSARDDRVCPGCLMSDGQQYAISDGFDEHVQGRCTMIPVLANVAPTTYQTGQEWFTAQPESTQLAILGRGRYDAWKRGDVSLSDMVRRVDNPTWGGSLQTARVGDLAAGRRGAFVSVPGRGAGPVMPVAPPTMPKFATVQDAQEWAKTQLELDADYSSATLDQATSINRAVFDVQQRYKGGKFIDKIEFIDENHEYTAVAIGKTIKFNRGAFSDEAIQAINSQELAKLRKLPERIQTAWKASVNDVMKSLKVRDANNVPLYSE